MNRNDISGQPTVKVMSHPQTEFCLTGKINLLKEIDINVSKIIFSAVTVSYR